MEAGDSRALLALIADLRKKVATKLGVEAAVLSCFETGGDGFWLHRLLAEHGVISHVVEPTSILVNRRATKTDFSEIGRQFWSFCSAGMDPESRNNLRSFNRAKTRWPPRGPPAGTNPKNCLLHSREAATIQGPNG
jgi:hypothetical protein